MSDFTLFLSKFISEKTERKFRNFRDKYLRNYRIEKLPKEIYNTDQRFRKISYCITCTNRLFHLKETIFKNIKDNKDYPDVEFVIINYNSKDKLHEWVKENLMSYIEAGVVSYYVTYDPEEFHASKAKNLAHKLAKNELLINLDGDNYTGKDFSFYVNHLFNTHGDDLIARCLKAPFWGVDGRICLSKEHFNKLGGYDESFYQHGYQDHDLVERAKVMGLKEYRITIDNFLRYLSNSQREKVKNVKTSDKEWKDLNAHNRNISAANIKAGVYAVNKDGWGKATVYKNFSTEPIVLD